MNRGLRNYTKQLTQTVGNAGEVSININKEDANLHITLPLITTVGLNPIETSLIFNLQDKEEGGMFGKGVKLNLYSLLEVESSKYTLKNADGSKDVYLKDNDFSNNETNLSISKVYDDNYELTYHYLLKDKYGDEKSYYDSMEYPKYIKTKSSETLTLDFISTTCTINNGHGDVISFVKNSNGLVENVIYYHNSNEVTRVVLSYTDNVLTKLTYKNGTTIISSTTLKIESNTIQIMDDISEYRIKYNLSENRVVSFIDGYDSELTYGKTTTIVYDQNRTTVVDESNNSLVIFFDNNQMPLFEMDSKGNVVETEYDFETKVLTSKSSIVSTKNRLQNLFPSNSVASFTAEGVTVEKINCSDTFFSDILGDSIYKVTGNGAGIHTLSYKISTNGIATDKVMAIIFGKQLTEFTDDQFVKAVLYLGTNAYDVDYFKKESVDGIFDLMTLGVNSEQTFDYIKLEFVIVGNASIELGGIQVIKKDFGSFYNYDESGNAKSIENQGSVSNMTYTDENMPSTVIGEDSSSHEFDYNENLHIKKIKTAYGVKIENEYDSVYENNIISSKTSNSDETKILLTKKSYTSDGRFVNSEEDELGNKTTYSSYNSFGKPTSIINALNILTNYEYTSDGSLKQILLSNNISSISSNYTYDSKKRLKTIELDNGSIYDFNYDNYGNIIEIKLNNITIFKYNYDLKTGNLIEQSFGANGDKYRFEYNNNLMVRVYYVTATGVETLKYEYEYNDFLQLIKIKDGSGNILNEYSYDDEGNVISNSNLDFEIKNTYDNLGKITLKSTKIDNKTINLSYDTISRSKGAHPDSLFAPYQNNLCFIGTFEDDGNLKLGDNILKSIDHDDNETTANIGKDGIIGYANVNSTNKLSYKLDYNCYYPEESGCVQFWFKSSTSISSSTRKYLFSCKNPNGTGFIGAYLLEKKVVIEIIDNKGVSKNLLTSDFDVDLSSWNFFALDFMNRYDGYGYDDVCEYALTLNAHTQVFSQKNPRLYVSIGSSPIYNIGHKYDGSSSSYCFVGKIACLMISARKYVTLDQVQKYYRLSKDYIMDNQLIDTDAKTVDFSQTNLFTINSDIQNLFNIYPLQNSVVSLNGDKPIKFSLRNVSKMDRDRTFNFNPKIKRYAYVADGSELVYNFGQSTDGTIVMRAFTDTQEEKQYFFEGVDSSNHSLGLYRNSDNIICIDFNGTEISTGLEFSTNKWHTIGLSFGETISSDSQATIKYKNFRVFVDEECFNTSNLSFITYGALKVSIGRKTEGVTGTFNLGNYKNVYPLYGQIEMLSTRSAYCEFTTLKTLESELIGTTKVNEFDELGMLKKTDLHKCGNSILSNTYEYKTKDDTRYISKLVNNETIKLNNSTITNRSYTYDAVGNVISISDSKFGTHNYQYDYRGFLINDDGVEFNYDENGNIIKKGDVIYEYDNLIKDRLTSVAGKVITYYSNNPGNPKSWNGNTYTFEGRRLTRYTYSSGYYDYKYNDQGLRIEKKDYRGITWKYNYDGNKLVSEISPYGRLDFLYDENNELFGFVKDSQDKYFYIRDTFKNILGIVNENGELIVQYSYDAYGKCLSVSGNLASTIGILNPIRYKGYYFDSESGMYYCKFRYYVPDWGRWLNIDNALYMQTDKINGLNLYSYCGNNPVSNLDKNGKFWFTAMTTIVGAIVGAASAVVTTLITGEDLSWKTVAGGAINGAVTGFILGISKGTAIGAASYTAAAVESAFYEICDYASGKELNVRNIAHSIANVATDTLVNGSINYACNLSAAKIPSIKTNPGWFVPKTIGSYVTKTYGQRMIAQTIVAGVEGTILHSMGNKIKKGIHDFVDEVVDYILYKDPITIM